MLGNPRALVGIEKHDLHKLLRANMNPFFSMQKVRSLEPDIQNLVDKLCARFNEQKGAGPVNTQHAYSCFSTDVISDYALGSGFNYLDSNDFVPDWSDTLSGIAEASAWFKPFPQLLGLLQSAPQGLVSRVNPGMGLMFAFQRRCAVLINSIIAARESGDDSKAVDKFGRPTLFHHVVNSDLPPSERGLERLAQEAQATIGAGAETVSKTLAWTTYHLLANPDILAKMKEELNRLDPECKAGTVELEKMPYVTSVMLEGLRTSYGVSGRLQRIAPDPLKYGEYTIPAGTPVGMSSVLVHDREDIFPEPRTFRPERWLDPADRRRLEPYMVAFSKGSRACLGINLARAELLLALSNVFRKVNFELYETTKDDVTIQHEIFLPFPKKGSKGVRVLVV
jgi:cytochrome P450